MHSCPIAQPVAAEPINHMSSIAVENYIKQIFLLAQERESKSIDDNVADEKVCDAAASALVPMGRVADALNVAPGTATAMMKRLAEQGSVVYEPYSGVKLTADGLKLALHIIRRHRLIETLLVDALGLDWAEVHDEAERLEHAVSDKLVDRIDAFLDYPGVDPHGDPIPDADGSMRSTKLISLTNCRAGATVRITRILDQDEAFLQYIDKQMLRPGTKVVVQSHNPAGDIISLQPAGRDVLTIGTNAAEKILVEEVKA
jgi:DtxR family Mn-dependent transcriptional regulator